jgi:hypothetical protein
VNANKKGESDMKGVKLIKAMEELGIDKQSFRVLGLLPLVYVAWADGTVQCSERSLIERLAASKGWLKGGGDALLQSWLREPPSADYVDRGLAILEALSTEKKGIAAGIKPGTLESLLVYCRDVAAAAGGLFGIHDPVTDDEAVALQHVADAWQIANGEKWQSIVERIEGEEHLAPGPQGHLLLGVLPELASDILGMLMDSYNQYGEVVRMKAPGEIMYLVTSPEDVQYVLGDNQRNFPRGRDYDDLQRTIGRSLLTTDGDEWRPLRRMSQPAFHHKILGGFGDTIVRLTKDTLDGWTDGETLDISHEMMQLTLRVIGELSFSTDLIAEADDLGAAVSEMIKLLRTSVEIERAALAQPAPGDQKVGHEWFPPSSGGTLFPQQVTKP